jgi:hypothetical protein
MALHLLDKPDCRFHVGSTGDARDMGEGSWPHRDGGVGKSSGRVDGLQHLSRIAGVRRFESNSPYTAAHQDVRLWDDRAELDSAPD